MGIAQHWARMKPMWQDAAASLACRYLATGLTFIAGIITARLLGAEGRGALSLVQASIEIALLLAAIGLPKIVLNIAVRLKLNRELGGLFSALLLVASFGALIFLLFLHVWQPDWPILLIAAAAALFWLRFGFNIIDARERAQNRLIVYNFTMLAERVLALCGLALLFFIGASVTSVVGILVCSSAVVLSIYICRLRLRWRLPRRRLRGLLYHRIKQQGMASVGTSLLALLMLKSDVFLLNWRAGEAALGQYAVAMTLLGLALTVQQSLNFVQMPRFMRIKGASQSHEENISFLLFGGAVCLVTLLFTALAGYYLLVPLYGDAFAPAVALLFWYLPFSFFISLRTLLAVKPSADQQYRFQFWRHLEAMALKAVLLLFIPITPENLAVVSALSAAWLCFRLLPARAARRDV